MSAPRPRAGLLLALWLLLAPGAAGAQGLDWEVHEDPDPPLPVAVGRNLRDGILTFADAFWDLNTGVFGSAFLLVSQGSMAVADVVGLVDDNPVTQHVTKAVLSKNVARTAYLWHVAGAEAWLGSHGMAKERWAAGDVAQLNPLLSDEDVEAVEGPLPLDPLDYVGEGLVHGRVYRPHAVLLGTGAMVLDDVVLRPVAGLLRIVQLRAAGDAVERRGNGLVRRAVRTGW